MNEWRDRIWTNAFGRSAAQLVPALTFGWLVVKSLADGFDRGSAVSAALFGLALGLFESVRTANRVERERALIDPEFQRPERELALGRALRTGVLPDDPALAAPLGRLVDARWEDDRYDPLTAIVLAVLAVGVALITVFTGDRSALLPAAVMAVLAVLGFLARRRHRILLRLRADLSERLPHDDLEETVVDP